MRSSKYVEELHCNQRSRAVMTYSSRIPLAPRERTHGSENPVVPSKYVLCTHLHVGSDPLPKYVWGARVSPLPSAAALLWGAAWLCCAGAGLAGGASWVSAVGSEVQCG